MILKKVIIFFIKVPIFPIMVLYIAAFAIIEWLDLREQNLSFIEAYKKAWKDWSII